MRILDGCCGIGGISRGLTQGGRNEVWGTDINPQLRDDYLRSGAAEFICADILEVLTDQSFTSRFDFIHMSPPCQHWSSMCRCRPGLASQYPDLITPGRPLLEATGKPWIIENVSAARRAMRNPVTLCMIMFGREAYRHRLLEAGGGLVLEPPQPPPAHASPRGKVKPNAECGWPHLVPVARAGHWQPGYFVSVAGHERREPVRQVMEIDWARNRDDIKEAVPPYVGAWIAEQAAAHLAGQAARLCARRVQLVQGPADVTAAEAGSGRAVLRVGHHFANPLVQVSLQRESILRRPVRGRSRNVAGGIQGPAHETDPTGTKSACI